jgi:large subunit ribosomal protein L21
MFAAAAQRFMCAGRRPVVQHTCRALSAVLAESAAAPRAPSSARAAAPRSRVTVVSHIPPAGAPAAVEVPEECQPVFAIIKLGGTQYKVTVDDVIAAEKVIGPEIGELVDIKDVLLVGTRHITMVGQPVVPRARVQVLVEEHTRDEKVVIFKKRRRKSSKRTKGFRREVTVLRVMAIKCDGITDRDGQLLAS